MAVRSVVAFVGILSVIVPLATWAGRDKKLDPAAVRAMCHASADASRAARRATRDFDDARAASQRGGWDQSLTRVYEDPSWRVAERARWGRLSAELIATSRKQTEAADLALSTASDLSEMLAEAVGRKDDASIGTLDRCRGDVDRYAKAAGVDAATMTRVTVAAQ
jgi:hypothetical protein